MVGRLAKKIDEEDKEVQTSSYKTTNYRDEKYSTGERDNNLAAMLPGDYTGAGSIG